MKLNGVYIPLVTPFLDGQVDYDSYARLVEHYAAKNVSGLIPLGTTGESPAITDDEYERIVEKTLEIAGGRVPVYVGLGGNYTDKVIAHIKAIEKYGVDGILSVAPYYNRPDQRGMYRHFLKISEATDLDIIIYNIPYRTGRNIENDTLRKLAELPNIIGLKDSCGDIRQTTELLLDRPDDFSILTGEDALYYTTLALGGDGGILASAHLNTEDFLGIYERIKLNDHRGALEIFRPLAKFIPLLFAEPNPAPIKYCLKKQGLIASGEVRLPLVDISPELASRLDKALL